MIRRSPSAVRALGLALALLALAMPALPQQIRGDRFEVEILVFRAAGDLAAGGDVAQAPADAGSIQPTTSAQRRLADAASRLRSAGGYRIIAHTSWTQAPAAWNSRRGVAATQLGLAGTGLDGFVILERGQYLHLGFDLRYSEGGGTARLNEVRRVKLNERQYFDHPSIGIIALVTPIG